MARSVPECKPMLACSATSPRAVSLWEQIHPKDKDGLPARSLSGKYHVRCFVMDKWRRVTVDDRIPVGPVRAPRCPWASFPCSSGPCCSARPCSKLMAAYRGKKS